MSTGYNRDQTLNWATKFFVDALLLEERGSKCRGLRDEVKKLYSERSKAIHGGNISDETLRQHVAATRSLLARLLAKIIQDGKAPTKEDFEEYLNQELKDKMLVVQDLTYTDESGLHHLVDKSQNIFN